MSTVNDTYNDDETDCQFCARNSKCSNKIFHIFDILLGTLILLDSFVLFAEMADFIGFILPVYFMFIGAIIIMLSVCVPKIMNAYCPFYFTFLGRGISYLLLGSVILVFEHGYSLTVGSMTIIMAFVYFSFAVYTKWFASNDNDHKSVCINLPQPFYTFDDENGENDKVIEVINIRDEEFSTDESNHSHRSRDRQIKANEDIDRALTMAIQSGDGVVMNESDDAQKNDNLHHL